jgi:26S proteasome regulatory subunit N1
MAERPAAEIAVPSKDPTEKKKEDGEKKPDSKANGVKDEEEDLVRTSP